MGELKCQRHHGWSKYELSVEPATENHHYTARITADPTERINNHDELDFELGDTEAWSAVVDEPDADFLTVTDRQPDQRAFTVGIGETANETRGSISGEFERETVENGTIQYDNFRFDIPLPAGQPITIMYHLLEENPAEKTASGLIEKIHTLYDESKPYKELFKFQSDAGIIVSTRSQLRIINKLGIVSEQYKQSYGIRAEESIANRLLGRPEQEKCVDSREDYETIVETHNSPEYPGLPHVDRDAIQEEYYLRYVQADAKPQTQPKTFGFDRSVPLIQTDYGTSRVASALLDNDVGTVRKQLEELIPESRHERLDDDEYDEKKATGEGSENGANERAQAWEDIVPLATTERLDEFEYVLANYFYWTAMSTELGPEYGHRLFGAAARLFSPEHADISLFHRKAKIRFHKQRARQLHHDNRLTEEEREERFIKAAKHYQEASDLARESTATFNNNTDQAAEFRCDAASMWVRHFTTTEEFDRAFEEVEDALDTLDAIFGNGRSKDDTLRKRLQAERAAIEAEKEQAAGNFRPATKAFWRAYKLFDETRKEHSAAHMAERIKAMFHELEEENRGKESDAVREEVREAYENTCAACGAQRLSPHGEPEVEIAHIKPKEDDGIYLRENLLPLCRFHHWAFDADWFYLNDDYHVHVVPQTETPGYDDLQEIDEQQLQTPSDRDFPQPHELFLSYRRQINDFADDELPSAITSPTPDGESGAGDSSDAPAGVNQQERKITEAGFFPEYDIPGSKNDLIFGPGSSL